MPVSEYGSRESDVKADYPMQDSRNSRIQVMGSGCRSHGKK